MVKDASLLGWGGHLVEVEIRGLWSATEAQLHIQSSRAESNLLGTKSFPTLHQREAGTGIHGQHTAMWYCNKQGRMGLWTLCQEALRLWTWLEHQGISLVVQHLAGSQNRADKPILRCLVDYEWRLQPRG